MTKLKKLVTILLIALWPTIFLFTMGLIQSGVRNIVSVTYEPSFYIWQIIAYFISGLIFAAIGFCRKNFKSKDVLFAHIAAVVLIVLISAIEVLFIFGIVAPFSKIDWWRASSLFDFAPFVLGYTICTSIRAVVLFRRQVD